MRIVTLALIGAVISTLSVVGFVAISNATMPVVNGLALMVYALLTILLMVLAARSLSMADMMRLAALTAVLSVTSEQILAFTVFRGMAKDIDPFSVGHTWRLAIIFALALGWYFAVAAAAKMLVKGKS